MTTLVHDGDLDAEHETETKIGYEPVDETKRQGNNRAHRSKAKRKISARIAAASKRRNRRA